jgi:hypothetical protein
MTRAATTGTSSRSRAPKTILPDQPRAAAPAPAKIDRLIALLQRPDGASLDDLCHATGWQRHSVRGALAGSIKRKGHRVVSQLVDGVRRYRIAAAA